MKRRGKSLFPEQKTQVGDSKSDYMQTNGSTYILISSNKQDQLAKDEQRQDEQGIMYKKM